MDPQYWEPWQHGFSKWRTLAIWIPLHKKVRNMDPPISRILGATVTWSLNKMKTGKIDSK
jgi:hypothetical protein